MRLCILKSQKFIERNKWVIGKPFEFNLLTEKDAGTKWFDKLEVVFVLEDRAVFFWIVIII